MKKNKTISMLIIVTFLLSIISTSDMGLFSQSKDKNETADLLKKAEENYQNGNFRKAIEIYENIITMLNQKKELAQTKQKLLQTMISLALTYFTINENDKAKSQLEKLLKINPKQELDPEFYPVKFIDIFKQLKNQLIGGIEVTSNPENAEVLLNEIPVGKTPIKIDKQLKGEFMLTAKLMGFLSHKEKIIVNPKEITKIHIIFKKEKIAALIEKPAKKPKKKKKVSPLLIIGGAAVVTTALFLLLNKKKDPPLKEAIFGNEVPSEIFPSTGGVRLLQVERIRGKIERVVYRILIEHPAMEDLAISILGTDNRTSWMVWNRNTGTDTPQMIHGNTTAFNETDVNGLWKLVVQNRGSEGGAILEWFLRIYYRE